MDKKKYHLYGTNKRTGCVFDIEFKGTGNFSRAALRDMVLVPQDKPESVDRFVKGNDGARNFFKHTANEFKLTLEEIDNDITTLERRILRRRRK